MTDGQSIAHTVTIPTALIFYQPSLVEIRTPLSMLLRLEYLHVNMDKKPVKCVSNQVLNSVDGFASNTQAR